MTADASGVQGGGVYVNDVYHRSEWSTEYGAFVVQPTEVTASRLPDDAWSALDAEDAELFGIGAGAYTMDAARIQYQQQAGRETARIVEQQIAEAAQLRAAAEAQRTSQVNRLVSAAYAADANAGHSMIAQDQRELNRLPGANTKPITTATGVEELGAARLSGPLGRQLAGGRLAGEAASMPNTRTDSLQLSLLQKAKEVTTGSLQSIDSLVESGDLNPYVGAFLRTPVRIGTATFLEGPASVFALTDPSVLRGIASTAGDLLGPDPAARDRLRTSVSNYFSSNSFGEIAADATVGAGSLLAGVGVAGKIGELRAVANAGADFVGPTIGRSGFKSTTEFSDAVFAKYQGFVDEGYAAAQQALQNGTLRVPPRVSVNTALGSYADDYARTAMNYWRADEGVGQLLQVNRYLRDPLGTGAYRIPDVNIPAAGQIYDATLGYKWFGSTPQITDFYNFSGGSRITIVRPTSLGGSYSLIAPH